MASSSSPEKRNHVPSNIFFDADLLFVPSFEEVGIPQCYGRLGEIKCEVQVGNWVNRGDVLLRCRYLIFRNEQKPRWFGSDPLWVFSEELISPISGLVIGMREEEGARFDGGIAYYGPRDILPVILVPRDEPPQDSSRIYYFRNLGRVLRDNWARMQLTTRDPANVRVGDIKLESDDTWWRPGIVTMRAFNDIKRDSFEMRSMTEGDARIYTSSIQYLRAHNLDLRDKLVHLTRVTQG